MKKINELKLAAALQICESENRSIEYTIEFLKQTTNIDHDGVVTFLVQNDRSLSAKKELNELLDLVIELGKH